jgi:hypothetical protein
VVAARRTLSLLVLALGLAIAPSCGEPTETCTCSCECGSGQKSKLDAKSLDDCSQRCKSACTGDSYRSNYDCTTSGAVPEGALRSGVTR